MFKSKFQFSRLLNLENSAALVVALAILPSFTALSETLKTSLGGLGYYLGPINLLKISFPILLPFIWHKKHAFSQPLLWTLSGAIIIGSLATLIAGIPCHFPPSLMREWSVVLLGLLGAASLVVLPERKRTFVLAVWLGVVFGSIALDLIFPSSVDWLYTHIFDPKTRNSDMQEIGRRVLTGIYGRQSLAKLLVWLPWLFFAHRLLHISRKSRPIEWFGCLFFVALAVGLALATTQRGPFVAGCVGIMAFVLHQAIQVKDRVILSIGAGMLLLVGFAAFTVVPRDILESRLKSIIGVRQEGALAENADANKAFRIKMFLFSVNVAKNHPWGHACIPDQDFRDATIFHYSHAHNLFLQQFRERGWLWGTAHLVLWLLALIGSWRAKNQWGSALFAGMVAIFVTGLFDHPWPVLNHSIVLWAYLLWGLMGFFGDKQGARPNKAGTLN